MRGKLEGRYQQRQPELTPEISSKLFFQAFSRFLQENTSSLFCGDFGMDLPGDPTTTPKMCGSPNGPPVTVPRIRLKDGRHLAYKEHGVPRHVAKYKIIYVHGFRSGRHNVVVAATLSPEVIEELGVYIVSFDRPGYGESAPNPKQTVKSMAMDIEELADQLGLGSKFYVIGYSIGRQAVWSCLKYMPNRLAGATLLAPAVTYW